MKSKFQAARDAMYQKRLKDMGAGKKGKKGDGYKYTDGYRKRRRSLLIWTVSPLTQGASVGSSTSSLIRSCLGCRTFSYRTSGCLTGSNCLNRSPAEPKIEYPVVLIPSVTGRRATVRPQKVTPKAPKAGPPREKINRRKRKLVQIR